jgi:hypothetical protein
MKQALSVSFNNSPILLRWKNMLSILICALQVIAVLAGLVAWAQWDSFKAVADQIQRYDDIGDLKGHPKKLRTWLNRRKVSAFFNRNLGSIAFDESFPALLAGVVICVWLFATTAIALISLRYVDGQITNISNVLAHLTSLATAALDAVTFDVFVLLGVNGQFQALSVVERVVLFAFLASTVFISSSVIINITRNTTAFIVSQVLPVTTRRVAQGQRETLLKRVVAVLLGLRW